MAAHGAHPSDGVAGGHFKGGHDGVLEPVNVVRVHQDGLTQGVGCTGEFTQDECAAVGGARSHVFLGDQVHAVAQCGHQHHVRREVEGHHFLHGVTVVEVADRGVLHGVEGAVDMPDGTFDLLAQQPVLLYPFAAGAGHLDERGILDRDSAFLEELLVGFEPVADSFGVVQPVHPEQDVLGVAEFAADFPGAFNDVRAFGEGGNRRHIDRDGEGFGTGDIWRGILAGDLHLLLFDGVGGEAADTAQEVVGVAGALEPDKVRAEQSFEHLPPPGKLGVDFKRREGDVVKEADIEVRTGLPQQLRYELELVVLHPHGRSVGGDCRRRIREALVDVGVDVPPRAVKLRRRNHIMVKRP